MRHLNFTALTILGLGVLVITLTSTAESAQNDEFSALVQRISRLEERVDKFEQYILAQASQQETPRTPVPAGKEKWRRLRPGMTEDQVRSILGEPRRITGGYNPVWYYTGISHVQFVQGKAYSWVEP